MFVRISGRPLTLFHLFALLMIPLAASAQSVDSTVEEQLQYQQSAQESQSRIESLDDEALALLTNYNRELERHQDLLAYNDNMRQLLASQEQEKLRLHGEIAEVDVVRQAIVPLMMEMVDVLEQFITLDQPMLMAERTARLATLRDMLGRSDVDLAEKYRRVIEAYQIEAEYGQNLEAYEGQTTVGGRELTVDLLRVGRVALYYLSLDRSEGGVWDPVAGDWAPLPDNYLDGLDYAVRVARQQAPPNLVELPLWTRESP
ncbi:MAG: hypothetical protein RLZZ385_1259 [Pseudomonadota bacterium]|jgi:hypothetical protein